MVQAGTSDRLPSWNDTPTTRAIMDFVARVTADGGPDYVPPEARVAVFDNDGTLWCEKPLPIQADFLLRQLSEMAERDPALRGRLPWKAAYEGDYVWLGNVITKHYQGDDSDLNVLLEGILLAYAGATIEEFEAAADQFLNSAQNPQLKRPYLETTYMPMVELLRYLTAHGFTNYIASGGGRDFMRPITQRLYDIPPERVIGSTAALEYREVGNSGTIVHKPELEIFDDGPAKPVRVWSRIGCRPILVGGNANGDIAMLTFAAHPSRPSLGLLVRHDDDSRDIAYDAGAERALALAPERGWAVVSVKDDWATVFDTKPRV